MAFMADSRGKLDDAQAQIAQLRAQVESLLKDRVSPAMSNLMDQTGSAAKNVANTASDQMREGTEVLRGRVKTQPLVSILVAAAVGWVIGRVMR